MYAINIQTSDLSCALLVVSAPIHILPWQGIKAVTHAQKYEKISEIKMGTNDEVLCTGFPSEFLMYFRKVKALDFDEEPDYMSFRWLFQTLYRSFNFTYEIDFDWTKIKRETASAD